MARKKSKKKAPQEPRARQGTLMDVGPKNSKEIVAVAREYKEVQGERVGALAKEVELKGRLLGLIAKEKLSRQQDGSIRITVDGLTISVVPRDDLVKVKEVKTDPAK